MKVLIADDDVSMLRLVGTDDYITKPVDREMLKARVKIGARIIGQRQSLRNAYVSLKRDY